MSVLAITRSAPSERRLTGGTLFLLAGLAALGELATNSILPDFSRIGANLGVSSKELGLTLSSFFVAFGFGQLLTAFLPVALRQPRAEGSTPARCSDAGGTS